LEQKYKPMAKFDAASHQLHIQNGRLKLMIDLTEGLNPCLLEDMQSNRIYADRSYMWQGIGGSPTLVRNPSISEEADGSLTILIAALAGIIGVEYRLRLPVAQPGVLFENLTLSNLGSSSIDLSTFACGFVKGISETNLMSSNAPGGRICELPYRYHNETGELRDYSIVELLDRTYWYSTVRSPIYNRKDTDIAGSEAWAWYDSEHKHTLLISKYNPDSMEWSLIQATSNLAEHEHHTFRFGGAGIWKLGDPEGGALLEQGAVFTFGETRYSMLDGGWKEAIADYRNYTTAKGHRVPESFNPPVHWNELYDNPYWWHVVDLDWNQLPPEKLSEHYRIEDMKIEAEKANEFGCGCLYLDPGWDTDFGSAIWDHERLGPQSEFVRWLRDNYGMELALHTPLAPWNSHKTYPVEIRELDRDGNRRSNLCVVSKLYQEIKVARLIQLCRDGAYFLMYDGSWYEGPCYDPTHGHAVPSTRQEHVDAILEIASKVHEQYPDVLIEQHDPIIGPGTPRYAPTYFMHGKQGAFDELWGFEYMIDPWDDIMSHRAFSLYYLNLAYHIPVYLHIDLRKDNSNALMFWWYASTCRHLGIGGKHPDLQVWESHKIAMKSYLANKEFYAQGEFYGLDELTHVHTLPQNRESVMNIFNLANEPITRRLQIRLPDIGLPIGKVEIGDVPYSVYGDTIQFEIIVPAFGHHLLKISVKPD
jgi:hypothetical protein